MNKACRLTRLDRWLLCLIAIVYSLFALHAFICADIAFRADRIVHRYGESDKSPEARLHEKDKHRRDRCHSCVLHNSQGRLPPRRRQEGRTGSAANPVFYPR